MMINEMYGTLPDDRPITALCVVENIDKCPKGFYAVAKSYDHDDDADLWKECGFFGKKVTRYLCLSKTEGATDRVVESIAVLAEKQKPPDGFTVITTTLDTGQKAWRKKRLCYKAGHLGTSLSAVTDIIVLSRSKKAPEEFTLCGVISGMTLCHKVEKRSQPTIITPNSIKTISLGPDYINAPILPSYANDSIVMRKAPAPPPPKFNSNYATMSGFCGLEGVPFVLNPALKISAAKTGVTSVLKNLKTSTQIDHEYFYDFRTEREVGTN